MVNSTASSGSATDWKKLKVQELRDELTSRGLDSTGLKAVLIERLETAVPAEPGSGATVDDGEKDGIKKLDINDGLEVNQSAEKKSTENATVPAPPAEETGNDGKPAASAAVRQDGDQVAAGVHPAGPPASATNGKTAPQTDLEKKQRRAERFGLELKVSENEKRRLRAARFGDSLDTKSTSTAGTASTMSPTLKDAEAVKRKARAARFGINEVDEKSQPSASDEARKKARLARFGLEIKLDPLEAEKKKLRAERFGLAAEENPDGKTEKRVAVEQSVAT